MRRLALTHVVGVLRGSAPRPAVHDVEVRVLVVDREHAPAFFVVVQRHAVVVVAEGEFLALPRAPCHVVERDPVGPHRLAPLGDDVPVVARGNGDRVEGIGGDGLEREHVAGRPRGGGPEYPRTDHEGGRAEGDAGAEEAATRDLPVHQPAEVGLHGARMVDFVELLAREFDHWRVFGLGHVRSPVVAGAAVAASVWTGVSIRSPTGVEARRNALLGAGRCCPCRLPKVDRNVRSCESTVQDEPPSFASLRAPSRADQRPRTEI